MTGDEPTQHCEVAASIDLEGTLSRAGIEHLEVDEQRTVVIYQTAILMLIVREGEATAMRTVSLYGLRRYPGVYARPDR